MKERFAAYRGLIGILFGLMFLGIGLGSATITTPMFHSVWAVASTIPCEGTTTETVRLQGRQDDVVKGTNDSPSVGGGGAWMGDLPPDDQWTLNVDLEIRVCDAELNELTHTIVHIF